MVGFPSAWPLTPGPIVGVGAVCSVVATALVANLWWLSYRRTRQTVVGSTAGALSTALREMARADVPDPGELRRCVNLTAGLERLIDGEADPCRKGRRSPRNTACPSRVGSRQGSPVPNSACGAAARKAVLRVGRWRGA